MSAEPLGAYEEREPEDPAYWDDVARETREHLRAARRAHLSKQRRDLAFYAYVVVLFAAFYIAPYTGGILRLAEHRGVVSPLADRVTAAVPLAGTGLALAALVAAVSDALWRGPVVLDPATAGWLLPAPASWGPLLRPRLRLSLASYASVGAIGAAALAFLAQVGSRARVTPLLAAAPVAGLLLGVAATAAGALVERHDPVVRRRLPVLSVARLALLALAAGSAVAAWRPTALPRALGTALMWSGPWGWAAQPVAEAAEPGRAPLWPLALVLLAGVSAAAYVVADRAVSGTTGPVLRARVETSRGVVAAVVSGDVRQAQLAKRAATSAPPRSFRIRLPPPRRRWLLIPWRVATGWLRSPSRLLRAALAIALAYGAASLAGRISGWERAVTGMVGVVAAYAAAGLLLEAARIETDDVRPSRALPIPFPRLLVEHGLAPMTALLFTAAPAAAVVAATGARLLPVAGVALGLPAVVGAALVAACRGPLPSSAFLGSETAMGNTALVSIAFWYLRAPLAGLVVAVPPVLLAAAGSLNATLVGYVVAGTGALWWWAHHAARRLYQR